MDFEKIKIELQEEDIKIIEELNSIQGRISDIESKKLNSELMDSIKQKSIETITMALGVSDILENTIHNTKASNFDLEMKNYLEWENTPKSKRTIKYENKYTTGDEFQQLLKNTKNLSYKSKEHRKTIAGRTFDKKKKEIYKNNSTGEFSCEYTGKKIYKDKSLENSKRVSFEHIYSVKEVYNDKVINYTTDRKERQEFLNSDDNIAPVRLDVNQSLNDTSLSDVKKWQDKQSKHNPNKTNAEYYEVDKELMNETINKAEENRTKFLSEKEKKRSLTEKGQVAGVNALKSGAKAAVGQLLTITVVEIIDEFKESNNNEDDLKGKIKRIQERISQKTSSLLETFKSQSINSFLSTLLDALLNSVFKIFKNILKFIKVAFHSLIRAFKVLTSSKYSKEEKLSECRKILGATVATLIGLALDEIIEKALISAFPFTVPFAGYVSPILSGLIVGIGSVLIMNGWEKYKANFELKKLKKEELIKIEKTSKISEVKAHISDAETSESILITFNIFEKTLPIISSCKEQIETSMKDIKETSKKINQKLDEVTKIQDENSNLLSRLKTI